MLYIFENTSLLFYFTTTSQRINTPKGFEITFQPSVSREGGYGLPITIQLFPYTIHACVSRLYVYVCYVCLYVLYLFTCVYVYVLYSYYKCYKLTLRVMNVYYLCMNKMMTIIKCVSLF